MNYKIKISIPIIIFLMLDFALIFFSRSFVSEIKRTSSDIFLKRSKLILLEGKAQKAEEFSEIFKKEEKSIEKINSSFIDPEMPLDFISFLEKTAKDFNLAFQFSITPPTKEKTSWSAIGFQINLAGFYSDVFKFLKRLYYSPYLVEIQNLEISRVEKEKLALEKEIPGNVKANLLIKVFAQGK